MQILKSDDSVNLYTEMLEKLSDKCMRMSMVNDEYLSKSRVFKIELDKYTIYLTDSAYISDYVMTVRYKSQPVYITYLNNNTVVIGFRHAMTEWTEKNIFDLFTTKFFDELKVAMQAKERLGDIHDSKFHSSKYSVWNFHNYDVIKTK